jgi:hypothetical protein
VFKLHLCALTSFDEFKLAKQLNVLASLLWLRLLRSYISLYSIQGWNGRRIMNL